jgi:uncharacterized protein (DUF1697 family)
MANNRKYIAFLRGINVGGIKLIKMDALTAAFTAAGFRKVKTYIASGNVIFESGSAKLAAMESKAEKKLLKVFGHQITVIIFSVAELEALLKHNVFKRVRAGHDVMLLVTFLKNEGPKLKLPLESKAENLKVMAMEDRAAFTVARRKKTGWFGFPNNFIEKQLGVAATTRQWRTVERVVAASTNL